MTIIITEFDFELDEMDALYIKISLDSSIYSFKITYWLIILPNS